MSDPVLPCDPNPRRRFLEQALGAAGGVGLAAALGSGLAAASPSPAARGGALVAKGDRILFQGDSITDAGRSRENEAKPDDQAALGSGYAWLAAAPLLVGHPDWKLEIWNRGISGHKVFQLAERWERDCLALEPDLLSILIGVNDIWHALDGHYDGTVEVYEHDYDALLSRTREVLPKVKLVVCEPFVLRCGAVGDRWFPSFDGFRAAAARVAKTHGATWVPFQAMFDEAVKYAPPEHWAADGVHPTPAGASLMAWAWLKAVGA